MSVETINAVELDSQTMLGIIGKLRGAPLSVYIDLATNINWDNESSPSLETIRQETGYSIRKVKEALRFLEREGLITPLRAKGSSTVYRVNHCWPTNE